MTSPSPDELFSTAEFGEALRDYVAQSRWFRAKARSIAKIGVDDAIVLPLANAFVLVLEIGYTDGETDRYILPISIDASAAEAVVQVAGTSFYNALSDEKFRKAVLNAIACDERLKGRQGVLAASKTSALEQKCGAPVPESVVSRAEQSNTSIIYRDRYILKLFRKLEAGINPDVEIGNFLTARGFANTPAVLGNIEYRRNSDAYAAGILQQFVPNQGDAWKYTLESLAGFFEKATGAPAPKTDLQHPLELGSEPVPDEIATRIGSYLDSARLLGQRTAEMHRALCDPDVNADFAPEPFAAADREKLYRDLVGQADIAFELLRRKQAVLSGATAESARRLLRIEAEVTGRFAAVREHDFHTVRIRHHGDYHLGQVLFTGSDFMIIDFEGEPARPLAERRAKALALRDVAGMVRSFQYAAFSALFGQVPGLSLEGRDRTQIETWAAVWNAYVSAAYLQAYFQAAEGGEFVPSDQPERRLLLDVFLLQKALYEVAYELNNRPDWLRIPLQGILSLVS